MGRTRARLAIFLVFALSAVGWAPVGVRAESTLRIGMTAADIPLTTGIPDQGGEGYRFIGYQLYDALVNWDLSRADVVAPLTPGLATEWHSDSADPKTTIGPMVSEIRIEVRTLDRGHKTGDISERHAFPGIAMGYSALHGISGLSLVPGIARVPFPRI